MDHGPLFGVVFCASVVPEACTLTVPYCSEVCGVITQIHQNLISKILVIEIQVNLLQKGRVATCFIAEMLESRIEMFKRERRHACSGQQQPAFACVHYYGT